MPENTVLVYAFPLHIPPPLIGTQNKIPNSMEGLSLRKDEGLQQS